MALVALLFAHHAASGSAEPRATIDVGGLSVLERQALLARRLGAERLLVIAERMPPGLAAALTRLRDVVEVVRDPASLATRIGDGDRVLAIEEGLIPSPAMVAALVDARSAALAVKPGEPPYPGAERLDSRSFWAGIALYDGRLVRAVAVDLGEWDLQSTLLRSAAGEGIAQVETPDGDAAAWRFVVDLPAALSAEQQLTEDAALAPRSWPSRYLYWPIERLAVRASLPTRLTGPWLTMGAAALGVLAGLSLAAGWLAVGLVLAIVAPVVGGIGAWLGRVRLEAPQDWLDPAFDYAIEPLWSLGLAYHLADEGLGVGAWALAAGVIAFRIAGLREQRLISQLGAEASGPSGRAWLELLGAGRETLPWVLLPFGLAGAWGLGLAALAVYAGATFFAFQSRLAARVAMVAGLKH
jgi:hypothetical protein